MITAIYILGIPPELIKTGRGIKKAKKSKIWQEISAHYVNFRKDLVRSGYYLNKKDLEKLSKVNSFWQEILNDVKYIEEELETELDPESEDHFQHQELTTFLLEKMINKSMDKKEITGLIFKAGKLRRGFG